MKKSLFIITFGPAGSGKGYIEEYYKNEIYNKYKNILRHDNFNPYYALIDDYIEKDYDYNYKSIEYCRNNIEKIRQTFMSDNNNNNINLAENIIKGNHSEKIDLANEIGDDLGKIYFDVKKKYNATNDNMININLAKRNDIVYETTGNNKFDWIFEETHLKYDYVRNSYIIIIVYPFVRISKILERACSRFIKRVDKIDYNNISDNDSLSSFVQQNFLLEDFLPPRLPKLSGDNSLYGSIKNIQDNISDYMIKCATGTSNVNEIMLYDNNNQPVLSIYNKCDSGEYVINKCANIKSFLENNKGNIYPNLQNTINKICVENKIYSENMNGGNRMYYNKYMKYKSKYISLKRK